MRNFPIVVHKAYGARILKPLALSYDVSVCAQSLHKCFKHKGGACQGFSLCGVSTRKPHETPCFLTFPAGNRLFVAKLSGSSMRTSPVEYVFAYVRIRVLKYVPTYATCVCLYYREAPCSRVEHRSETQT